LLQRPAALIITSDHASSAQAKTQQLLPTALTCFAAEPPSGLSISISTTSASMLLLTMLWRMRTCCSALPLCPISLQDYQCAERVLLLVAW
jgi:hypothetical protein